MDNLNKGHRQRMRERYIKQGNLNSFKDHEILEMLLFLCLPHRDTNKIAHALIDKFGSLAEVFDADRSALAGIKGISEITALNICLIKDTWNRYVKTKKTKQELSSVSDIVVFAKDIFTVSRYEELIVAYLDFSSRHIGHDIFTSNSLCSIWIEPKEIVTGAIKYNAAGVMLLHGHITGVCEPSPADIKFTEQLYFILSGLSIAFLDHIIMNEEDGYYSFRQNGHFKRFGKMINKEEDCGEADQEDEEKEQVAATEGKET